jgi:RimJ/RimL family protein N-acetyltransferase
VLLVKEWWSNRQYMGEHQDVNIVSEAYLEEIMLSGTVFFIVEKKDGNRIGHISSWTRGKTREIGYALVPSERGKGYGTEVIKMMLDYLFLKTDVVRIQVPTEVGNLPSRKALKKAGFKREGRMRKSSYVRGEYRDMYLYSILREEWKSRRT